MDAKLKTLTVPVLKEIISKANIAVPGKAKKPDLIQKILDSPEAIAVYEAEYGNKKGPSSAKETVVDTTPVAESAEEPSPTEEVPQATKPPSHAGASEGSATLSTAATPTTKPADIPAATSDASKATGDAPAEDEETAKRRARAARFGIPFVEKSAQQSKANGKEGKGRGGAKGAKAGAAPPDDPEKLNARAARFGIQVSSAANGDAKDTTKAAPKNGKKRGAPAEDPLDPEELERRKKRAERFGIPIAGGPKA